MSLAIKTSVEKFRKCSRGGSQGRPNNTNSSYRSGTNPNLNTGKVGNRKCFICDKAGHFITNKVQKVLKSLIKSVY